MRLAFPVTTVAEIREMAKQPTSDGGSLQDFIAAADQSVKEDFAGGKGLHDFLATIDKLTLEEKKLIVEQAIKLLEGFYVHLPLKRAMHAVDPLQSLRLLQRRLPQLTSEIAFHHEMTTIFTSLRDLHTNYFLPSHFSEMAAYLPFQVEACFENGKREYIVSKTQPGLNHATFVPGVKLTYWNGIPIDRAVEIAAFYHAGSNPAARHAHGVAGLTKRFMSTSPPPDEEWVVIGYEDLNRQPQEFRSDWFVIRLPADADAAVPEAATEPAAAFGFDVEGDTFLRINKLLFAQRIIAAKQQIKSVGKAARDQAIMAARGASDRTEAAAAAEMAAVSSAVHGTESTMPDVFAARVRSVSLLQSQPFWKKPGMNFNVAYVRIFTFQVQDDSAFVNEFLRLIELPVMQRQTGLIIDVRGNSGGLIWAGERLLQLLTPKTIEPCRVQFINTPASLQLCQGVSFLEIWKPSVTRALETGATFSAAFPITPPERCNDIGQRWYKPVVLITDANCYSTTDIFAAGFQDHKIGHILGTDNNTGAGGANVWTLEQIRQFFTSAGMTPPLAQLPKKAGMRVAIRRTLRVGDEAGTELEDLGVRPDFEHQLTRADTLSGNEDLIAHAGSLLIDKPYREIVISEKAVQTSFKSGRYVVFELTPTLGVDYVTVFVDGRPRHSLPFAADPITQKIRAYFELLEPEWMANVELRGYAQKQLVCYRRLIGPHNPEVPTGESFGN
jgi:C-terminal processing protease CtpA/Prc